MLLNAEVPADEPWGDEMTRTPAELCKDDKAGMAIKEVLKKFARPEADKSEEEGDKPVRTVKVKDDL